MAQGLIKRSLVLLLIMLIMAASGCSLLKKDEPTDADTKARQEERDKNKDKDKDKDQEQKDKQDTAKKDAQGDPLTGDDGLDLQIAAQQEHVIRTPADHQQRAALIRSVITDFMENMKAKQTAEAKLFLYGTDHKGGVLTLEELQQEMEILHPVTWRLDSCQPVEQNNCLVTITLTWPDATQRQMPPFNMLLDEDNNWYIHFNSFAAAYHSVARPLLKDDGQRK